MGEVEFTTLGLRVSTLKSRGLDAAISDHDKERAIPYSRKCLMAKRHKGIEDNVDEFLFYGNSSEQKVSTSITAGSLICNTENNSYLLSTINTQQGEQMNKAKAQKFLETNKQAVLKTAHLALGKMIIDTMASKLPSEVGELGPLAIAGVVCNLPIKNAKVAEIQTAALSYALYAAFNTTIVSELLDTLTGLAEEEL